MVRRVSWIIAGIAAFFSVLYGNPQLQLIGMVGVLAWLAWLWSTVLPWIRGQSRYQNIATSRWGSELGAIAPEVIGPGILLCLALLFYGRLLLGDVPVGHDHPVALLRAHSTGQLLSTGSVTGYSTQMFAGYPANTFYPVGADLLTNAIRAMSLGLLSWPTAYSWALFVFIVGFPLAVYGVGRHFSGRVAGTVAAVFVFLDHGQYNESGWEFAINFGVWPMGLSFALCLLSYLCFDRLLTQRRFKNVVLCAVVIAVAVLAHPMAIAILGVTLPLFFVTKIVAAKLPPLNVWLPSVVAAGLLGIALAGFWLVPFIARKDWYLPLGMAWRPFDDTVRGLVAGQLLPHLAIPVAFGGICGLVIGTIRRHSFSLFLFVTSALLLFVGSDTFLLQFDICDRLPLLANLQPERFAYFIRTALFIGFGFFAQHAFSFIKTVRDRRKTDPGWRLNVRRLLIAVAVAPFLLHGRQLWHEPFFIPAIAISWSSRAPWFDDLRKMARHVNELPDGQVDRLALFGSMHDHRLLFAAIWTQRPIFKVGFTPQHNFKFKIRARDPRIWQLLNVSHVISLDDVKRGYLELVHRIGVIRLYRFKHAQPFHATVVGPGKQRVERNEAEAMDIRLIDTAADSQLIVHRAGYALWHASLNGEPVAITTASLGGSPPMFMKMPARDGLLRLRYRAGVPEWVGRISSWLALAVLVGIGTVGRVPRFASVLDRVRVRLGRPVRRVVTGGTIVLVGAGALVVLARLALPAKPYSGRQVIQSFAPLLPKAWAEVVSSSSRRSTGKGVSRRSPTKPSGSGKKASQMRAGDRGVRPGLTPDEKSRERRPPQGNSKGSKSFTKVRHDNGRRCDKFDGSKLKCPGEHWHFVGEVIFPAATLRKCIWMHPVADKRIRVHFDDVALGQYIQGYCGLHDGDFQKDNPNPVVLRVSLNGDEISTITCPFEPGWHRWQVPTPGRRGSTGKVTFATEAKVAAHRRFCFIAATTVDAP